MATLIDKKEQTFRDAIYQLIFMRFLYHKLQKSVDTDLRNLSISTGIDDVVFVDVVSNRYYESEEQRKILMEHFNVHSNHPNDSGLHHSQAGRDGRR